MHSTDVLHALVLALPVLLTAAIYLRCAHRAPDECDQQRALDPTARADRPVVVSHQSTPRRLVPLLSRLRRNPHNATVSSRLKSL